MESYRTLEKIFKKISDFEHIQSILHWDLATMMPAGAAEARADQLATLESVKHAILTDDGVEELLQKAIENKHLDAWQKANLRGMVHKFNHTNAVPRSLLVALTKAGTECEMVWRKAKAENDFATLKPYLKNVVDIVRKIARAKADALECSPYDALLDYYDPGRKSADIEPVFEDLKAFLPEFVGKITEKQKKKKTVPLKGPFPIETQKELASQLLEALGFNRNEGRLDESSHPFCGGYPGDIRITTRYKEDDFMPALMGILHEGGHAMYEAGLPRKWLGQPVGHSLGMAVHESQSLLIEMQACRSRAFFEYLAPHLKKAFNKRGKEWNEDNLHGICTKVEPSFIRVDADEVTYPLHIIIRYTLEKYLISGEMEVDDIPEAWAQGMERFLGIKPETDREGCLQDIHWMDGTFGYFPTYTLGAIMASQFYATALKSNSEVENSLAKGDFLPLKQWLNSNIHEKGSLLVPDALLEEVTGSKLDTAVFKNHLQQRYLEA